MQQQQQESPQAVPQTQVVPQTLPQPMPVAQTESLTVAQQYKNEANAVMPGVVEENSNMKSQVGEVIYPYIDALKGEEFAPKITGMLIDLPIIEIKEYLVSYDDLLNKVEAAALLLQESHLKTNDN